MSILKYLATFFVGFICASALFIFVILPKEAHDKFEFGRTNGIVAGHFEAADALQREFGLYDGHSPYRVLFSEKTTDVISIETNGVKTVRVIP
jgi:hypothetical protein